jgi:hypothetical protein
MNDSRSLPEPIVEHASACVDYVRQALGVELDFAPETLPVLDHYASTVRQSLATRPELEPLIARALGAYFGEVVRGRWPGFWLVPSQNVHDWAVCLTHVFLSFNPIGVAYDTLFGATDHGGPRSMLRVAPEDQEFLEQRLAAIPPVPEEEYFLFSTRLEVIEVAIETLHARMLESGYEGTLFQEEDYVRSPV